MKPSHLMYRSIYAAAIGTALVAVAFVGCSKKSETTEVAGGGLTDSALAKRIPPSSTGFIVWDSTTAAAKNFRESAWSHVSSSSILEALKKIDSTPEAAPIKPFLDALTKTGIITTEPGQPAVVQAGVGFLDPTGGAAHKPGAGLFILGAPGQDLKTKLKVFEETFAAEGYSPVKRSGNPEGFSIPIKPPAPEAPALGSIHFVASADKLAVVTDEGNIARLFGDPSDDGMQALTASEQYKATMGTLPGAEQLSAAYLDVQATLKSLSTIVPAAGMAEVQAVVNSVPVQSLAWSHRFVNGVRDTTLVHVVPQDEQQKLWLAAFNGGTKHETLNQVPADSLFALSLDASALSRLRDTATKEGLGQGLAPYQEQLAALDSLNTITLSVRGASQTSPFPEVLLAAGGSDGAKTYANMKGLIDGALAGFGMQLGDWQSKEVQGTTMNFLMSPLGVGAFAAQSGGAVLVASSEAALTDAIAAGKDHSKSLRGAPVYGASGLLGDGASFLYMYMNFERTADMLKSMQGSMAMFTGGQAALPDQAMDDLRKAGAVSASFSYKDTLLRMESRYDAPTATK